MPFLHSQTEPHPPSDYIPPFQPSVRRLGGGGEARGHGQVDLPLEGEGDPPEQLHAVDPQPVRDPLVPAPAARRRRVSHRGRGEAGRGNPCCFGSCFACGPGIGGQLTTGHRSRQSWGGDRAGRAAGWDCVASGSSCCSRTRSRCRSRSSAAGHSGRERRGHPPPRGGTAGQVTWRGRRTLHWLGGRNVREGTRAGTSPKNSVLRDSSASD